MDLSDIEGASSLEPPKELYDAQNRQMAAVLTQYVQERQFEATIDQLLSAVATASLQQLLESRAMDQIQLNDALEEAMVQLGRAETEMKDLENDLTREHATALADGMDSETASIVEVVTHFVADEFAASRSFPIPPRNMSARLRTE